MFPALFQTSSRENGAPFDFDCAFSYTISFNKMFDWSLTDTAYVSKLLIIICDYIYMETQYLEVDIVSVDWQTNTDGQQTFCLLCIVSNHYCLCWGGGSYYCIYFLINIFPCGF